MMQIQVNAVLDAMLAEATNAGQQFVDITANDINRRLPFTNETTRNRHPMCCKAMRQIFDTNRDKILNETPSGESSSFAIRFALPR